MENSPRLLRLPDVTARVGLRRAQIYLLIQRGEFPAPVRLARRTSAWRSDEVDAWIAARERVVIPTAAKRIKSEEASMPVAC